MSLEMNWKGPFRGERLVAAELDQIVGAKVAGIYLWRKVLESNDKCLFDAQKLSEWLDRGISSPILKTDRLRIESDREVGMLSVRANFATIDHLTVGGGELPEGKRETLLKLCSQASFASDFYSFMHASSSTFGPVLYVGESSNLRDRFRQHLGDSSPLKTRLKELGLTISDAALHYCELEGADVDLRRLLESALTHVLVAPLTIRAG